MTTRYVRVVLAYDAEDAELLRERLDAFIEDDDDGHNGITGAHVSGAYPDREAALRGPWLDARDVETVTPSVE